MLITTEMAEKVRVRRARLMMNKTTLSTRLGIARQTLVKIERGQYNCPSRIYEKVVEWLLEDL